jgi:hypothetical protein
MVLFKGEELNLIMDAQLEVAQLLHLYLVQLFPFKSLNCSCSTTHKRENHHLVDLGSHTVCQSNQGTHSKIIWQVIFTHTYLAYSLLW